MKKIITIISIIMIFITINYQLVLASNIWGWDDKINISPIVQIISYKNIYWKYVEMLWWWSASIINDDWIIVTNNHVVDDWTGKFSDIFNICITKKIKEKPECNYTATLINRDVGKDFAILKIDPTDINWKEVDYTKFKTIDIDYNYEPTNQDDVIAIWYPWVGSDTITETKWIISWVSKYNEYNYIKTDTLIAWWNSWWALVKWWKLIWIPTFLVWWFFDPALWYALSISEAKDFIKDNIWIIPETKKLPIDFKEYRSTIEKINESNKVEDSIFNIKITNDYEVYNYIKNKKLDIRPREQKEIIAQSLMFDIINLKKTDNEKDFLYQLESLWFYSKSYNKMKKVKIGWLTFYYPYDKWDNSQWDNNSRRTYITKLSDDKVMTITMSLTYIDEKNKDNMQKHIKELISNIDFNDNYDDIKFDFSLNSPKLEIEPIDDSAQNDISGIFTQYLGNLHEFFIIKVYDKDLYSGKWQTNDEIYTAETVDISQDFKTKFILKWHAWFMYCGDNVSYNYIYEDEFWNTLNQTYCILKITEWVKWMNDKEYIIEWRLTTDKKNNINNLDKLINHLRNKMIIDKINTWSTTITNLYKNQIELKYQDIKFQPKWFKEKLKLLIKYWIIKNKEILELNKPMKRGEFLMLYFHGIYWYKFNDLDCVNDDYKCIFDNNIIEIWNLWEKISLSELVSQLGIDLNAFVNANWYTSSSVDYLFNGSTDTDYNINKIYDFTTFLNMKLAGVKIKDLNGMLFSEEFFQIYNEMSNEDLFSDITKKLQDFQYKTYWLKKVMIWEIINDYSSYIKTKQVRYNDDYWLILTEISSSNPLRFGNYKTEDEIIYDDEIDKCYNSTPKNLDNCLKKADWYYNGYNVLLKWDALDIISNNMDYWLFDPELAKKKSTMINDSWLTDSMNDMIK